MEKYTDKAVNLLWIYGPKIVLAIVTLIVGLWVIKAILRAFNNVLEKRKLDPSLKPFLKGIIGIVLKAGLVISVAGMVGIETTSFIAVLGAVGLAIGMALSGTLQNFAGGVIILTFKPFKVGDFITAQGFSGTVNEIQIFNTILKTPDNKIVIIPNSPLSSGSMINFSTESTRRVDMNFGIGYGDDIDKAKEVLKGLIEKDERILKEPAPFLAVSELGESSVNFVMRVWANAGDYWDIFYDMQENVKKAFDKEGVSIPFPQMDIHFNKIENLVPANN